MVRAERAGRKTQTRRIVKGQPANAEQAKLWRCPYGAPGDRLYVRETWAVGVCADGLSPKELNPVTWLRDNGGLWFAADSAEPTHPISERGKTRVSIHMPRWASRTLLDVVSVRVERLQDISEDDAKAEGVVPLPYDPEGDCWTDGKHRTAFESLWNEINGWSPNAWEANPWVWVITFKRVGSRELAA
jgi:hypothetical protein